jgi:alkanesulfonate monooxygenase SsuD/methylene tetrahydromethanopterin reductase-like flavin-dependent oxidoreductase (luciferase family)
MLVETYLPLGKTDPGLRAPEKAIDLATLLADARQVEDLGYDTLVVEETKDDPYQVMAIAAVGTTSLKIATSVAMAFPRAPAITAMSAWSLQRLSRGRFTLGLGSQVRGHITRRFGLDYHPPGPWMRDYVGAVRAVWHTWQTGAPLAYESERYRLSLMVPAAERGAAKAGRTLSGFQVAMKPLVAAARTEAALAAKVDETRARIAFYCSTPSYRRPFELHGYGDLAAEMAQLSKAQRWDEMQARVPDDLYHAFVTVGTYDDIAAKLRARYEDCVTSIEFAMPVENAADAAALAEVVRDLRRPPAAPAAGKDG